MMRSRMVSVYLGSFFLKSRDSEFTQYRIPVGWGPSSKTCPRWPPQFLQRISTLSIPSVRSGTSTMLSLASAVQKLGQPEPESYFVSEEKSSAPQAAQTYTPLSLL